MVAALEGQHGAPRSTQNALSLATCAEAVVTAIVPDAITGVSTFGVPQPAARGRRETRPTRPPEQFLHANARRICHEGQSQHELPRSAPSPTRARTAARRREWV